jgi:hypothetical protein
MRVQIWTPYRDDVVARDELDEIRKKALDIVAWRSESRVDTFGGYPDQCAFIEDLIAIATRAANGAPELIIAPTEEFVEDNWEDFEEARREWEGADDAPGVK